MSEDRYAEARALVVGAGKAACSFVQRKLGICYNEAARYVERLEAEGFISPANHCGVREVLVHDLKQANERAAYAVAKSRLANAERALERAQAEYLRAAQGLEAAAAGETGAGSTEGESPVGCADAPTPSTSQGNTHG